MQADKIKKLEHEMAELTTAEKDDKEVTVQLRTLSECILRQLILRILENCYKTVF